MTHIGQHHRETCVGFSKSTRLVVRRVHPKRLARALGFGGRICVGETHIAGGKTFCWALPRLQVYGTYLVILAIATILSAVMTPGLPKAVVKIVAERNERIADVPINALYIAFFLSIAVSLPVIVVGFYSNLLNLLGITQYELIFGYIIAFLLTIYTVAQSFKLALYKIRFVVIADIIYWSVALIFFVVFRNLTLG